MHDSRKEALTGVCIADENGNTIFRHFCDCCADPQAVWADIQLFHALPGSWAKDGDCPHIRALKKFLGGEGSFAYREHLGHAPRFQVCECNSHFEP